MEKDKQRVHRYFSLVVYWRIHYLHSRVQCSNTKRHQENGESSIHNIYKRIPTGCVGQLVFIFFYCMVDVDDFNMLLTVLYIDVGNRKYDASLIFTRFHWSNLKFRFLKKKNKRFIGIAIQEPDLTIQHL